MDDKEIGRIWGEYYPRSGNSRDALQICGIICSLIREKSRLVISLSGTGRLQRVLNGCGISKADFAEVEKGWFFKGVSKIGQ
jgi:3-dehydroquinate dehydratase